MQAGAEGTTYKETNGKDRGVKYAGDMSYGAFLDSPALHKYLSPYIWIVYRVEVKVCGPLPRSQVPWEVGAGLPTHVDQECRFVMLNEMTAGGCVCTRSRTGHTLLLLKHLPLAPHVHCSSGY